MADGASTLNPGTFFRRFRHVPSPMLRCIPAPLLPIPRSPTLVRFHLDFALRWEAASCSVDQSASATDPEGAAMPAGSILRCESGGPLGTMIPGGPLCFWVGDSRGRG